MPISTREDYERALAIVRAAIRAWNPVGWIDDDTPANEFDAEAAEIVIRTRTMSSARDAAVAVSEVFSVAFGPPGYTVDDCAEIGRQVFSALSESGLLA